MKKQDFDVFLAHKSSDKPLIRVIAKELKKYNIRAWVDEEEILAGDFFQDSIQKAIGQVKTAAICIGKLGLGKWQQVELRSLISQCVDRQIKVIPVLLPGVHDIPQDYLFLRESNWVSFGDRIDNLDAIKKLAKGIQEANRHKVFSVEITDIEISENQNHEGDLEYQKEFLSDQKELKQYIVDQLTQSIRDAEHYLQELEEQRNSLEAQKQSLEEEVKSIDDRISDIERLLATEKDQSILLALDWLKSQQKQIAEAAGKYVLNKRESIEKESDSMSYRKFFWRLEVVLVIVQHHLWTDEEDLLFLVESMSVPPSQIDEIIDGMNYMRLRIQRHQFPENVKRKIDFALRDIEIGLNFMK